MRPKGMKAKPAMTKQARPQGMPMMLMKQSTPAMHQSRPVPRPKGKNQRILPRQPRACMEDS